MAELRFDGRVAVVTGAGRGLGRSYALLLASRGAKVVVNDLGTSRRGEGVDAAPAQQVVDEIRAAGGEAVYSIASVATEEDRPGKFYCRALRRAKRGCHCAGKAALVGLSNALALEGADFGIRCNCIVPAAETRLFEGRDTAAFPPMKPDLVAPAVAWLAHESCEATGELLVALAGRMAKAYVAETAGVFQPSWSIEQVAEQQRALADRSDQQVFSPVPSGFYDHLGFSFRMART